MQSGITLILCGIPLVKLASATNRALLLWPGNTAAAGAANKQDAVKLASEIATAALLPGCAQMMWRVGAGAIAKNYY